VLAHARALLASSPEGKCAYISADLRDPDKILGNRATRDTLDFSRPIGLLLVAVLHFIRDEERPERIISTLVDALPPGSYVVSSHGTTDWRPDSGAHRPPPSEVSTNAGVARQP
jgi:hypothetical protein